jgi:hypothetical protein
MNTLAASGEGNKLRKPIVIEQEGETEGGEGNAEGLSVKRCKLAPKEDCRD